MWKNKLFLKGLGIGLITGAVLLQLMMTVKQADEGIGLGARTIKKQATAAGLQVFEKDVKIFTQEQLDDAVRKAVDTAKTEETVQDISAKQVTVYIYVGMTAKNVADYLYYCGIISDRETFINEMLKEGVEGKIRNGLYTFKFNENIADVIRRITTPPPW